MSKRVTGITFFHTLESTKNFLLKGSRKNLLGPLKKHKLKLYEALPPHLFFFGRYIYITNKFLVVNFQITPFSFPEVIIYMDTSLKKENFRGLNRTFEFFKIEFERFVFECSRICARPWNNWNAIMFIFTYDTFEKYFERELHVDD